MISVSFKSSFSASIFSDDLFAQMRRIINDEMVEAAAELERESPVGATGDLVAGWDVIPARRRSSSFDVRGAIVNQSNDAPYRIRGRAPGKFPNVQNLREWVSAKTNVEARRINSVAFLIGRKIAREGTERFKDGDGANFAGLRRDGSLSSDSPVKRAERRISERFRGMKIKAKR